MEATRSHWYVFSESLESSLLTSSPSICCWWLVSHSDGMGLNRCTLQVRNASTASSLLCLVCVLVGSLGELLDLEALYIWGYKWFGEEKAQTLTEKRGAHLPAMLQYTKPGKISVPQEIRNLVVVTWVRGGNVYWFWIEPWKRICHQETAPTSTCLIWVLLLYCLLLPSSWLFL